MMFCEAVMRAREAEGGNEGMHQAKCSSQGRTWDFKCDSDFALTATLGK